MRIVAVRLDILSAIVLVRPMMIATPPGPNERLKGWINGVIGVALFSGSLPFTRLGLTGFDATFLTFARAAIAGLLALAIVAVTRPQLPRRADLGRVALASSGIVIVFPLLMAFAMQQMTSVRGLLFLGLLPMATAVFGVIRGGERPRGLFWLFSALGCACVMGFALHQGAAGGGSLGDWLMIVATISCALSYAEGGALSRVYGGWQVMCFAMIMPLPIDIAVLAWDWPATLGGIPWAAWGGLAYVSVLSMVVGFIFWYRGLAQGGIASVGQLQLLQPFFGFMLAALMLHEMVSPVILAVTVAVMGCVLGARKYA
jgi:drug/metabolite transporter (DMT)-like permease